MREHVLVDPEGDQVPEEMYEQLPSGWPKRHCVGDRFRLMCIPFRVIAFVFLLLH